MTLPDAPVTATTDPSRRPSTHSTADQGPRPAPVCLLRARLAAGAAA